MAPLALFGSPPGPHPSSNVAEWLFSNPFSAGSEQMKHAPPEARNHTVSKILADKPILVDPATDAQLTWSQAQSDALRVAAGFQALGLQPVEFLEAGPSSKRSKRIAPTVSPVVMIHLPNCLPFATLLFGVFAAGLTATLANPALTSREMAWLLQNSMPKVIVTTPTTLKIVKDAIEEIEVDDVRRTMRKVKIFMVDLALKDYHVGADNKVASKPGVADWKHLLHNHPLKKPVRFSNAECRSRTAVILWSSGTTGKSKGVLLSHHALTSSVASLWYVFPSWTSEERFLGVPPFYHVFGLVAVLLVAPSSGATIFVMPKFELKTMLGYVEKFKITFLHMAPPVAVLLSKSPIVKKADMRSVRGGMCGGAPLPPAIIESVYNKLGFCIKVGYGLSEAGCVCNQVGESYKELQDQLGSAGPPMYGIEMKIVSTDEEKRILCVDEEGEVLMRSPSILNCYFNNEAATAESLDDDGWFHTGDIGKLDRQGLLWITDRLKEMIKVKGFQVAPAELEALLCKSDQVADAAVTAVYDEESGSELPKAYIMPADLKLQAQCAPSATPTKLSGLLDLGQHVKKLVETNSVHYKWLRGNVVFVQQIPKSPAGKILRRMLKDVKGVDIVIYPPKEKAGRAKL